MKKILKRILALDTLIYLKIHGLNKIKSLHVFMKYLTHLGSNHFGFIYGGIILGLFYFKDFQHVDRLIVSILVSQFIIHSLKRSISRPRPYKAMVLDSVKRPPKCTNSFPSAHTSIAFITGLGWTVLFPSLTPVFLIVAGLVGLSRIVLGYHYPGDVLVGGTISYLVHTLVMMF